MGQDRHHRILIIDDNESIHRDITRVLQPSEEVGLDVVDLADLEAQVFGAPRSSNEGEGKAKSKAESEAPGEVYSIDSAFQGQEGHEKVKAAIAAGKPYSLAFVDMRMPPGWDGLVTIEHLWKVDPALQVVICSAYSDYSWSEIDKRLGHTDQLMVVKKPFDADGVRQVASHLTRRWAKQCEGKKLESELHRQIEERTQEIETVRLAAEKAEQAKAEFLSNVNHEVREPMTAILGYAELLLANEGVTLEISEQIEGLAMIKENGERLLEVVNEFLDLTKIEGGRMLVDPVVFSPSSLATEVIHQLRPKANDKELELTLDAAFELPASILSDPHRVRQVLTILVANAIRFTGRGSVCLRAHPQKRGDDCDGIRFEVSDTGVGIAPHELEDLFMTGSNSGSPTRGRFGGAGLGVSLVKKLTELMGGNLTVSSTVGEGTRFSLWIPSMLDRKRLPDLDLRPEPAHFEPLPSLDCHLLLVEDVRTNQMLISMVLRKAGARVDLACDGQEAIDKIHSAAAVDQPYDLILMDMQMPVLDGWEATRRLRSENYTGLIFALTGRTQDDERERCMTAGCDAFFAKPLDRERLIAEINERLQTIQDKQSQS